MALVLPLRRAAVGSVDDVPATSAGVRVLVHNGALFWVSCTTPLGRWLVVRTFSFPKVLWNSCRQSPAAPCSQIKNDSASWVSGCPRVEKKSTRPPVNSKKMQTNRLADEETLVGTSDDHGVVAGALLLMIVPRDAPDGRSLHESLSKNCSCHLGIPRLWQLVLPGCVVSVVQRCVFNLSR